MIARSAPLLAAVDSSGWSALVPWLLVLGLFLLGGCLYCLWNLAQRQREQLDLQRREVSELGDLRGHVARWVGEREALDLRRIEHVLVDVRDGQQRVEDALLRTAERLARAREQAAAGGAAAPAAGRGAEPDELLERIGNRLLALGYEQVQVVGEREALVRLLAGRGEVAVEARRAGVLHKGRALVHDGRITDIEMHPPYALFP